MRRYQKYEPVEFDYIHELPEGWQLLPNIAIFAERIERGHSDEELLAVTISKGIIKQTELKNKKDISNEDKSHYKLVKRGDLAYNKMRMWQGSVGYSQYQGIVSPAYVVLRPKVTIHPKYFHYLFRTSFYINYSQRSSYGICDDQLSLRSKDFKRMYSVVPPLDVQNKIVAYLDRKAERANEFLAKQNRLIEVLKEQKQAIINRAVTKGVNTDAPMKNSGVEWLGEIPSDWDMRKLKYLTKKVGSGVTPSGGAAVYQETGIPLLRSQNIHFEKIDLSDVARIPMHIHEEMSNSQVLEGDVLLNITGASLGRCYYVTKELGEANVNQHVCIVRPNRTIDTKFLNYLLASDIGQYQIWFFQQGGGREGLNFQNLKNFHLPLPVKCEQNQIVQYIEAEISRVEQAIAKAEKQIALANDYLHSLIFRVVTGQISVEN